VLKKEEIELLTRIGPGTPCGDLMRRYWHPIAVAAELTPERPKKRVKVLGEELVLFLTPRGEYGLVAEHCSHRGTSLYYGFLEDDGIRCAYHGWKYDACGRCLEQPFEPPGSTYKDRIRHPAYPVQRLSGLLFAYLGPEPAPLLPRWDLAVREDGVRSLTVHPVLNCNWLQAQENSVDPTHTHFLHAHTFATKGQPGGEYHYRPIEGLEFHVCEWGIFKRRIFGGENAEVEQGHLAIFPNILRHPAALHWRVPIDDTHTQIYQMFWKPTPDGSQVDQSADPPVEYPIVLNDAGEFHMDSFNSQDAMAWETQGPIFDRTQEHLGTTDQGIIMWRNLLKEQIEIVQRGGEPIALVRDPARNHIIEFDTTSATSREDYAEAVRRG
jgi:5,5'-dehydrodivanillate O-demethylase oxygenase subunit